MIKTLKFTDTSESKLFITGCTHFNHNPNWPVPLWKSRGYESAVEMTRLMIDKINEVCRQSDYLMVLGDFCLNTSIEEFWNIVNQILPKIYMVRGNHNNPWEKAYNSYCEAEYGGEFISDKVFWKDKIAYLGDYVEMGWNKQPVVCFHYPIMTHNYAKHGSWMLHSHNHNRFHPSKPETLDEGKLLECGWDTFQKPVSFEEIKRIMDKKPYLKRDDHH